MLLMDGMDLLYRLMGRKYGWMDATDILMG